MKRTFLVLALAAGLSQAAQAYGDFETKPFRLTSIGAIGSPLGLHPAGNVEITGTYVLLPSVCTSPYVTTSRANDPDRAIFKVLQMALQKKLWVRMRVTDDPARTAYPGRCSIVAAGLVPPPPVPTVNEEFDPPRPLPEVDILCMVHPEKPPCIGR